MHANRIPSLFPVWVLLCLALLLSLGCERKEQKYQAPPPPKVTVAHPEVRDITIYAEYTGTTDATESVDIRARVKGYLKSIHFQPTTIVQKGQLLFVIEKDQYIASVNKAKADLATAVAQQSLAQATLQRKESAYRNRAVSEVDVIQARAELDQAKASIEAAQAQLESAKIDLSYTEIHAPITGLISRNLVDVGNLVGASDATLLTSIVRVQPMYAYFDVSENDILQYRNDEIEQHEKGGPERKEATVYLGLSNEQGWPHQGNMDYADNRVNADTGTITVRGIFDNEPTIMLPGMFARIRLPVDKVDKAVLITERAVQADQGGNYVMVVNSADEVEQRSVTLGARQEDGARQITKGLSPEDQVVVRGLLYARPGSKVQPEMEGQKKAAAPPEAGEGKAAFSEKSPEKVK